jgi:hypothetical protein
MQQVPAGVAQLAEQPSCKRQVSGSIPLTGSTSQRDYLGGRPEWRALGGCADCPARRNEREMARVAAHRARLRLNGHALGSEPGFGFRDLPGRGDLHTHEVDRAARPVAGRVQHQLERRIVHGKVRVAGPQLGRRPNSRE